MKYIREFIIILMVSFAGEVLNQWIPLPIPASVYGFVLMFIILTSGIVKTEEVKEAGEFLIEIMPVLFIPAAAGLLESWHILSPILFPAVVITVVTTIAVMAVTGRVTQYVIRRGKKREAHE